MIDDATVKKIKSIKFYCMVPVVHQGKHTGSELKSTFHSQTDDQYLGYRLDTGLTGLLTVVVGSTEYIYKLSDIVGRMEVSL
ncbi:hypothetical protein [Pseudomonas aeruginosa]|uniref:hypothetical protein n=1 Tax=Pseudomonas aeruginosa TaxID=287 RepID=UPI003F827B43